MKKVLFKARLGNGPVHVVGQYEFTDEEWEEELKYSETEKDWLQNRGGDWAHDAVHSDCLEYWAETIDD